MVAKRGIAVFSGSGRPIHKFIDDGTSVVGSGSLDSYHITRHQMTGTLAVLGALSSSTGFSGDGSGITGIAADSIDTTAANADVTYYIPFVNDSGSQSDVTIYNDTGGDLQYNPNSATLTVTKLGAYEQAGAVDFSDEAMTNVNIDSGAIDGTDVTVGAAKTLDVSAGTLTTSAAQNLAIMEGAAANVDIGAYDLRSFTVTADSLTSGRVPFASTDGLLVDDGDFTFDTDTLTVTKLGAYEQAGDVDFSDEAMTNVNIDSGAIDGTTIGGNTAAAGTFTTVVGSTSISGTFVYGDGSALTNVSASEIAVPGVDHDIPFNSDDDLAVESGVFTYNTGSQTLTAPVIVADGTGFVGDIGAGGSEAVGTFTTANASTVAASLSLTCVGTTAAPSITLGSTAYKATFMLDAATGVSAMEGVTIGENTPQAGVFTNLESTGTSNSVTFGSTTTATDALLSITLGSGDLNIDGNPGATTAAGTIEGVNIGATNPGTGDFTDLTTSRGCNIDGGSSGAITLSTVGGTGGISITSEGASNAITVTGNGTTAVSMVISSDGSSAAMSISCTNGATLDISHATIDNCLSLGMRTFDCSTADDNDTLETLSTAPATYNGTMIYLGAYAATGTLGANYFNNPDKWYFCESGSWYPSPFNSQ